MKFDEQPLKGFAGQEANNGADRNRGYTEG